jgi:hypothetical protein
VGLSSQPASPTTVPINNAHTKRRMGAPELGKG